MDLENVTPLLQPWVEDTWGMMRPPVSVEAAQLSAELAWTTYHMDVERWLQAGWQDATIQVDGELTPVRPRENWLTKQIRQHRVQSKLHPQGMLEQLLGTLRQVEQSDTGKALVMMHAAPEGRYVVAVGFMGTGTRFYDWVSNFRMTSEEGVHRGFLQLTKQFEENEGQIEFPETARQLGLQRLTLGQVLLEMQHPHSRFVLWLAGHSQGGALAQVYAHRKIHEDQVLPRNIVGYGFASPSVMLGTAVEQPAAYPLYHIQNSDDVVPRCGAEVQLGVCLLYPADEALRSRCYPWPMDEKSLCARAYVAPIIRQMTDTAACIESMVAFLNVVSTVSPSDMLEVLGLSGSFPLKRVVAAADVGELVSSARRHAAMAYESITGRPLDQARVADFMADIQAAVDAVGLQAFGVALRQMMGTPHSMSMRLTNGGVGAYWYIVRYGMGRLIPFCWQAGSPPTRMLSVQRTAQARVGESDGECMLNNRHRQVVPRRVHRNLRYRDPRPRTDTRHRTPELQQGAMRDGEKLLRTKERKQ